METQREARRSAAFGRHSLFDARGAAEGALETNAPLPPADLAIEAFAGLPSGDAVAIWRFVGGIAVGGLANAGNTCYASSVAQVLLRVPAVALWLHTHAAQCKGFDCSGSGQGVRCVACALWATRLQLGSAALPELVRHRRAVDEVFQKDSEHDAAEFMKRLLTRMRRCELEAERAVEWNGLQNEVRRATHVDRLFGFVEETRLQCKQCRSCRASYACAHVLVLPVPPVDERGRPWTVTDLYYLWAKPEDLVGDAAEECRTCGGQRTSHVRQRRMNSRPNVVVVHVRRTVGGSSDVLRHPVLAEEEVSLPDVGSFELSGVVYHSGRTATRPHYSCVSRGPDRQFWRYDDKAAWRFPSDVGRLLPRSVYMLVYTRPMGVAGFAGMGEVAGPESLPPGTQRSRQAASEEKRTVAVPSAESPVRRRLARKTSVEDRQVPTPANPLLREATTPERAAKARRLGEAAQEEALEDILMDAVGRPSKPPRVGGAGVEESIDGDPGASCADASGGHRVGSIATVREQQAAAAEARALATQTRGVGDVRQASAMQAAAGVEQWIGASRAAALRERLQRSRAASVCFSQGTGATEKAVDSHGDAVHGGDASDSALVGGDAIAIGTASAASTEAAERSDLPAQVREQAPVAGGVSLGVSCANDTRERTCRSEAGNAGFGQVVGPAPERVVLQEGAADGANDPDSTGVPALDPDCFRTRTARRAPARGQASFRLLEPLPVDTAQRVYGIPSAGLAMSGWYAGLQPFGGLRNLGHTCFVNAIVQVLARVEGVVQCLRAHTHGRARADGCVLCALRDQVDQLREGRRVETSEVALLARRGRLEEGRPHEDKDFVGDPVTGDGPQCDACDCLQALLQAFGRHEGDKLVSELRDCSLEQKEQARQRPVLSESVCGLLFRRRVRCAQCVAVSDTLDLQPYVELDMGDNVHTSLKDLWFEHVREYRSPHTRCPAACGANGYKQDFLEREPSVVMFRLKRFYREIAGGVSVDHKIRRKVDFPEIADFMRSGEYHFAAAVQHVGVSLGEGHYVATVWEGAQAGVDCYRTYSDSRVGETVAWDALGFEQLKAGVYILVYVRTRFWNDGVGDGSERTPYERDGATLEVAQRYFRGQITASALAVERER